MLDKLVIKDTKWREVALYICKDRMLADDLVQEMYLKLAKIDKEINDFYVYITIKNLYINHLKQNKYICIDKFYNLAVDDYNFELDDHQEELINSLSWFDKELLELSYDNSLRELEKMLNINYGFIFRTLKEVKNKTNGKEKNSN